MKKLLFSILMLLLIGMTNSAEATIIDWASSVSNSNVPSAVNALGAPDGMHASFYDPAGGSLHATYSGFGAGSGIHYNTAGFASFLGVSETTLARADFFTAEVNGGTRPSIYENGLWEFSDGSNYLSVNFDSANPGDSDAVIGYGGISINNYANFFGFANPITPEHSWSFLLFDVDGHSNINVASDNFRVTLTAANTGIGPMDPDPDVMGRFASTVPEPSSLLLLGLGGLLLKRAKRRIR